MSDEVPDRPQGYTVHSLARDLDRLRDDVKEIRASTVGKDVFEIAQGANRVDIGRLDDQLDELDKALDRLQAQVRADIAATVAKRDADIKELRDVDIKALRTDISAAAKETDRRFRAIVVGVLVVFVAPLVVGLILVAVNLLGRQ